MDYSERYESFTSVTPAGLRCFACGAPADKKCSKCHGARYCSEACQRKHWPHHKAACKVDRKEPAPERETDAFKINTRCLHGAPPGSSAAGKAAQALMFSTMQTIGHADATVQLAGMERWVRANPKMAREPGLPLAIASMALDAFGNNDGGIARGFLRTAGFIESFVKHGDAFLAALHLSEADQPALHDLNALLEKTLSRRGVIEALRARTSCGCLVEAKPAAAAT